MHVHNVKRKRSRNPQRVDPTRTITIRKAFEREIARRVKLFKADLWEFLVTLDALGLGTNLRIFRPGTSLDSLLGVKMRGRGRSVRNSAILGNAQPREFAFASNPDKVKAFRTWLLARMEGRIIAPTHWTQAQATDGTKPWTYTYLESAYKKGKRNAFTSAMRKKLISDDDLFNKMRDRFLRKGLTPAEADKIELLATRALEDLKGVTSTMASRMNRILAEGLIEGRGPKAIAKEMFESVNGLTKQRAMAIARTEMINAHANGQLDAFKELGVEEVGAMVEFSSAGDGRVCSTCAALEGKRYKVDEAYGIIPVHANCLPGDSLVLPRSRIAAASKRWFDGELITIRTTSGLKLSGTPNHPILLNGRWLPLHLAHKGNYVIRDCSVEWAVGQDRDNQNIPAPIHEVAETFLASQKVIAVEMPTTAPDFHGDVSNGDIAIIGTDRNLGFEFDSSSFQHSTEFEFQRGCMGFCDMHRSSAFASFGQRSYTAPSGIMCCLRLIHSLFFRHLFPFQSFCFALGSGTHSIGNKYSPNHTAGNTQTKGNDIFALARKIVANGIGSILPIHLFSRQIIHSKPAPDDSVMDTKLAGKLTSGGSFPVQFDKIASFEVNSFHGYVYNLETEEHYYVANGITSHNCRCSWIPYVPLPKDKKKK